MAGYCSSGISHAGVPIAAQPFTAWKPGEVVTCCVLTGWQEFRGARGWQPAQGPSAGTRLAIRKVVARQMLDGTTRLYLTFRGFDGEFDAAEFRRVIPHEDTPRPADPEFTGLLRAGRMSEIQPRGSRGAEDGNPAQAKSLEPVRVVIERTPVDPALEARGVALAGFSRHHGPRIAAASLVICSAGVALILLRVIAVLIRTGAL